MNSYWAQFSHDEILSMHGIEIKEVDTDLSHEEVDTDLKPHYCGNCMKCLGMSWRDFY